MEAAGLGVQLVAGNTGAGVFPDLWRCHERKQRTVTVHVARVAELHKLQMHGGCLHIGAAVPIARVVAELQALEAAGGQQLPSSSSGDNGGGSSALDVQGVRDMWRLLQRVAGGLVRNAATLAGNLVLARSRGLESDVATLLLAAGRCTKGCRGGHYPAGRGLVC